MRLLTHTIVNLENFYYEMNLKKQKIEKICKNKQFIIQLLNYYAAFLNTKNYLVGCV